MPGLGPFPGRVRVESRGVVSAFEGAGPASTFLHPAFRDEAAARAFLEAERWPNGPDCPYCEVPARATPLKAASMGAGWYHCKSCRRKFTVRVGTLYERSHIPLHKWLLATYVICAWEDDVSIAELQRLLGITYKSAWHLTRRIREARRSCASPFERGASAALERA